MNRMAHVSGIDCLSSISTIFCPTPIDKLPEPMLVRNCYWTTLEANTMDEHRERIETIQPPMLSFTDCTGQTSWFSLIDV